MSVLGINNLNGSREADMPMASSKFLDLGGGLWLICQWFKYHAYLITITDGTCYIFQKGEFEEERFAPPRRK